MKKLAFSSLFILLPTCFFYALYLVDDVSPIDSKYLVKEIEYLVSTSETPPSNTADWQSTSLPLELNDAPGAMPSIWFRLQLPPDDARLRSTYKNQPALLFLAPYANMAIYINGFLVGQDGSMVAPVAYHRRAMLYALPRAADETDTITLLVHMVKPRPGGVFKPFYFATEGVLKPAYKNDLFLKLRLPQGIMVAMGFIAAIMALLFLLRTSETAYGWYAVMLLFWLLHHSVDLIVHLPVKNYGLWVTASYITLAGFVVFGSLFVNRFLGFYQPRLESIILIIGAAGAIILIFLSVFSSGSVIGFGQLFWVPAINILGIFVVTQLYRGVRQNPSLDNKGLFLVTYLVTVVGVRDYLFEVFPSWIPGTVYYLQYSSALVLLFFSLSLMRRFATALQEAENLNRDLERRIAQKAEELEENYLSLREVENKNTVAAERERIMRDMHDGFGGQLLQVLSVVESTPSLAPIEPTIREALHDLRLIIDSLSETDGNLLTVLGAFRHRSNKPIEKSGIALKWSVADFSTTPCLSPGITLQVLRILQEAVSNTIKHAKASQMSISTTQVAENEVNICIKDNGCGFDTLDAETGHGILNMRHRAKRINSQLSIVSGVSGTQIDLTIPHS